MFRKRCTNTCLRPLSYIFLAISLVITMISFCTSSWYSIFTNGRMVTKGIWNVCEGSTTSWPVECVFLPDLKTTKNDYLLFDIHQGWLQVVSIYHLFICLFYLSRIASLVLLNCYQRGFCFPCETPTGALQNQQ